MDAGEPTLADALGKADNSVKPVKSRQHPDLGQSFPEQVMPEPSLKHMRVSWKVRKVPSSVLASINCH